MAMGRFALILITLLALAGAARADVAEARKHFDRGMRAYNLQQWGDALREFKVAYVEQTDPVILFNIGQAQRQLGEFDAAAKSYRLFLANQPDAPNRDQVARLIEEMDGAAKEAHAKSPPTGTQALSPTTRPTPTPPQPRAKWYASPLGWSLSSAGVAAAAVGGGLLAQGGNLDSQIPGATSLAQAQQLGHDRDTYRIAGDVLLAVGGAALVAGVVVFVVKAVRGRRSEVAFASSGGSL